MIQRFFIVILLFLFADNIYSFQEEKIYEKYSSNFGEVNQGIFQKQLLNVLSYNIDLDIDVQEKTFSAEALINILITDKSIQDTFYFSWLFKNLKKIQFFNKMLTYIIFNTKFN